jgi:hypothetical protein
VAKVKVTDGDFRSQLHYLSGDIASAPFCLTSLQVCAGAEPFILVLGDNFIFWATILELTVAINEASHWGQSMLVMLLAPVWRLVSETSLPQ